MPFQHKVDAERALHNCMHRCLLYGIKHKNGPLTRRGQLKLVRQHFILMGNPLNYSMTPVEFYENTWRICYDFRKYFQKFW